MIIQDPIWGEINIDDPVILEIINTKAFQRLKEINQYGGVNFVYPDKFQVSRFEHSIGVWYILKRLGLPLEVQINGLLHDLGHMAFSHMVDQALGSAAENYHEKYIHLIEGYNEVIGILDKNNIQLHNPDEIPELKTSLPNVGADRLDYGLRDHYAATGEGVNSGLEILNAIKLVEHNMIFTNLDAARKFAQTGTQAMWEVIYEPGVAVVYQSLIDLLKKGLDEGWLTPKDLVETDQFVLDKIKENVHIGDKEERNMRIFTQNFEVFQVDSSQPYDLKHVKLKVRYFDPLVEIDGEDRKVSDVDPEFKAFLDEILPKFNKRIEGEYFKIEFK